MHVDAQNLAEQAVDVLPAAQRIATAAAVANRGIEISIGAEIEPAAFVIVESQLLVDCNDRRGARWVGHVRVRRHVIAANLGIAAGVDQIDVEKAVGSIARIESETEQTALAIRQDLVGDVEKRRCEHLSRA
jgi:hypothetical protein